MTTKVVRFKRPDVAVQLVTTNVLTRWPCHVCGGCTGKESVLAEVVDGEHAGLRVCVQCIEAGDIDSKLLKRAERLAHDAEELRGLVGRLRVPSASEYYQRDLEHEIEYMKASGCELPQAVIDNLDQPWWTHKASRDVWYDWLEREYGMSREAVDAEVARRRTNRVSPVDVGEADGLAF